MYFRVLGSMAVEGPGGQPLQLKGLRQRAVLAALLIEAGRPVSADELADMVWDGEPPRQAAGTLQAYLSRLRRILEPEHDGRDHPWQVLRKTGSGYQLTVEPDQVDAHRFESLCRRSAAGAAEGKDPVEQVAVLDEALALWQGEPYADFRYFHFTRPEVSRLEELRGWAVEKRAESMLSLGRHLEVASELVDRVRQDPYRERLRVLQMLALYRSGRQADALACYQEGRHVLVEELGLEPGTELRSMEQAIIAQDPALDIPTIVMTPPHSLPAPGWPGSAQVKAEGQPGPHPHRRPPMFGRDGELASAETFVEGVLAGSGGLLLVTGEAGIGKTRLAEELARWAETHGIEVHWGHCPEMEGAPPFWMWMQVLRSVVADKTLIPESLRMLASTESVELGPVGDEVGRFQLYESVKQLLETEAQRRPVLVVLEDLHWADIASLRLLRYVCASDQRAGRVAIVATTREEGASPALADLGADVARSRAMTRLRLEHLDRTAAAELVGALVTEEVPARVLDGLLERTAGNPFYIFEFVRLGGAGATGVPQGVREVIRRRFDRLGQGTQAMLRVAACCIYGTDVTLLADVLDTSPEEMLDRVEEALAARVLREDPEHAGSFAFAHPLLRDAIGADTSQARQAFIHRDLARAIEKRASGRLDDRRVAALAHHYAQAAGVGNAIHAVRWNQEAARRDLARWATEDARDRLVRTLDLARRSSEVGQGALVDLLVLLARVQRFIASGTGRDTIQEAMRLAREHGDAPRVVEAAEVMAADAWGYTDHFGQTATWLVDHLRWALPRLKADRPGAWVTGSAVMAGELIFSSQPEVAGQIAAQALAAARTLHEPAALLSALQSYWLTTWGPDSVDERRELVAEMDSLAALHGLDRARVLILRWATALERVDTAEMLRVMQDAHAVTSGNRHPALDAAMGWRRSLLAILDGRFVEAETLIGQVYELASRFNQHEAFDAYSGQLALLYWLWGRQEELVPLLEQAIMDQPFLDVAFGPVAALAWISLGQSDKALAFLRGLNLERADRAPPAMLRSGTTAALAVACAALADPALARTALRLLGDERQSPAVVDQVGVFYLGSRAAHRGRLHAALGEFDAAVAGLDSGMAVDHRAGAVVFEIRDGLDLAEALIRRGRDGDRPRALSLLGQIGEAASRKGLESDLQRAERLLLSHA
jgi:DNA-binding SARP family transcriptional activator/tetratricopeptide (TPR) repeat protein